MLKTGFFFLKTKKTVRLRIFAQTLEKRRKTEQSGLARLLFWQVVTQLIGKEDDPDFNQGYLINATLPPLIKAGKNPGIRLILAPPVTGAANPVTGAANAATDTATGPFGVLTEADAGGDDAVEAAQRATADNLPMERDRRGAARAGRWQAEH